MPTLPREEREGLNKIKEGWKKGGGDLLKCAEKVFRSEGEAITEERELLVESVKDEQGEKNAQFFRAE